MHDVKDTFVTYPYPFQTVFYNENSPQDSCKIFCQNLFCSSHPEHAMQLTKISPEKRKNLLIVEKSIALKYLIAKKENSLQI